MNFIAAASLLATISILDRYFKQDLIQVNGCVHLAAIKTTG